MQTMGDQGLRLAAQSADALIFAPLMMLCVVLPNSFKWVAAGLLTVAAFRGFSCDARPVLRSRFFLFYSVAALVTLTYCAVGAINQAPEQAIYEVLIIYIAAPLLWAFALRYVVGRYGLPAIIRWMVFGAWLACLSVAYYFFAYFTIGPQAVEWMFEEPNINVQGGYAAARMYVYGSLIFLLGGLLAAPMVVKSLIHRLALILACVVVTITSARGALILTIPLALLIGVLTGSASSPGRFLRLVVRSAFGLLLSIWVVLAATWILNTMWEIDFMIAVDEVLEKLVSLGGAGRSEQFDAFMDGIDRGHWMGEGHGISTFYTVSDETPWRYEMVWMASVFRVGLLGALAYAAPFLVTLATAGVALLRARLTVHERFLFGGFVCAFIASNTNPYIEGVVFQWMYVLPVVYFLDMARTRTAVRSTRNSARHLKV